jgi:uncharacterized damage-inducible protein DinB
MPGYPGPVSDEREMLLAWLDYERESVRRKVTGLTEAQARWAPASTANSLLGIVYHLAWAERWWFTSGFAGEPHMSPPAWADPNDRDWELHPHESVTLPDAVALYRKECARSDEIARAASSLDEVGKHERCVRGGLTLRWILNHMIEETARHAGHADITRELIDGSTGML